MFALYTQLLTTSVPFCFVSRFTHLINVSFFDDLFTVMTDLVDSGVQAFSPLFVHHSNIESDDSCLEKIADGKLRPLRDTVLL